MRIDAHQHYWHYDPVRDAWITADMHVIRRDCLPEHIAAELHEAGIVGVIAVQAAQSPAETAFLVDLASWHPMIRGVVGWIDLRAPDLDAQLDHWRITTALKGFRHIAQAEPDDFLARDEVVAGIRRLGEHDYSYDILVYPRQLAAATTLVERCPGVRFILDHCGKPPIASGNLEAWRRDIDRLARHPNVWCKVSGLVTEASPSSWTPAQLTPCIDAVAEAFGVERLIFGSDWPVCLVAARYQQVIDVIDEWAARLNPAERNSVFSGAARLAYQLES